MDFLTSGIMSITPQQLIMYGVGLLLIYLAIYRTSEPALLLPMGFGAIFGKFTRLWCAESNSAGIGETNGIIEWLFNVGIEAF